MSFDVTLPDGRTLHAREAGDPNGSLVIYHHGTPMDGRLLDAWADDAGARGLRLVGYDRAGYGGSDRNPGRSVADVANDIRALADHLGADRFATWGISGGGPHALACAALLPDRVTAAASVAGVGPFGANDLDFLAGMGQDNIDEFGAALAGEQPLRDYLGPARTGLLGATPEHIAAELASLLPPVDVAYLGAGAADFLHAAMSGGLAASADGWVDDDLAFTRPWGFDLATMTVPVLVLQGDQDLMVPFAHGQWLAAAIPGATTWLRPGEGHVSLMSEIGQVHDWLSATAGA